MSTLAIGVVLCGVFSGLAAEVYDAVAEADGIAAVDQPALRVAMDLRSPGLTELVAWFTDLGSTVGMTVIVVLGAVWLALRGRSVQPPLLMAVTAAGTVSMTVIGKAAVGRDRPPFVDAVPPFESSFSFPSGHSLNSLALIGALAYLAVRQWRAGWARVATVGLASLFVVAMGLSRIYLGHHWLTDVLGAWLIALAWLTVVVTAHHLYLGAGRARRRPGDALDNDTV
jgi:undecaprenyl-diphosphatase